MNLSRKRTAIFCGFVLAAVFIQAGAQSAGPHGVVTDEFGSPVINAILTLRNPNGTVIRETGADNHGRFFFEGLAPGSYVLTISAFQFEPRRMIFEAPRYELPDDHDQTQSGARARRDNDHG